MTPAPTSDLWPCCQHCPDTEERHSRPRDRHLLPCSRETQPGVVCQDTERGLRPLPDHPERAADAPCSNELRDQGQDYPRTCARCALGPCTSPLWSSTVDPKDTPSPTFPNPTLTPMEVLSGQAGVWGQALAQEQGATPAGVPVYTGPHDRCTEHAPHTHSGEWVHPYTGGTPAGKGTLTSQGDAVTGGASEPTAAYLGLYHGAHGQCAVDKRHVHEADGGLLPLALDTAERTSSGDTVYTRPHEGCTWLGAHIHRGGGVYPHRGTTQQGAQVCTDCEHLLEKHTADGCPVCDCPDPWRAPKEGSTPAQGGGVQGGHCPMGGHTTCPTPQAMTRYTQRMLGPLGVYEHQAGEQLMAVLTRWVETLHRRMHTDQTVEEITRP